ncbi:hypothetical protein [Nocardia sp. NPDC059228]|uniref:hypothetical protein n=1 Tax=Nocardia sp. NPDC059228 TaxID=3346777 RepID=UPI0036801DAB
MPLFEPVETAFHDVDHLDEPQAEEQRRKSKVTAALASSPVVEINSLGDDE